MNLVTNSKSRSKHVAVCQAGRNEPSSNKTDSAWVWEFFSLSLMVKVEEVTNMNKPLCPARHF